MPWVRGVTTVENATPDEVLATIQVPDMRKKWCVLQTGSREEAIEDAMLTRSARFQGTRASSRDTQSSGTSRSRTCSTAS